LDDVVLFVLEYYCHYYYYSCYCVVHLIDLHVVTVVVVVVVVNLQFIQSGNAANRNAVWGSLEDILTKMEWCMYRIIPNFQSGDKSLFANTDTFWTIGIDVIKPQSTKPNICCISLSRDVYDGSTRSYSFHVGLLPQRHDIIGLRFAQFMWMQCIKNAVNTHVQYKKNKLPNSLIILRKGTSEGQIEHVATKEYAGLCRALYVLNRDAEFVSYLKTNFKVDKWEPKIVFAMITRGIIEKVAQFDQGNLQTPTRPIVVHNGPINATNLWDAITFFNAGSAKARPSRLVVIYDGLNIAGNIQYVADFYQFLYSLGYGYGFSIPFPMGPTALPSPIQYARHYAQWFGNLIFSKDQHVSELIVNSRVLIHRPHVEYIAPQAPSQQQQQQQQRQQQQQPHLQHRQHH